MRVRLTVTACAADIGARVDNSNSLLLIVYVTDEAAAVVGSRAIQQIGIRAIIQQQRRFIIKQ